MEGISRYLRLRAATAVAVLLAAAAVLEAVSSSANALTKGVSRMSVSGASRFGSLLTGARAWCWRSLTAVVVALLLLASPSLLGSASANSDVLNNAAKDPAYLNNLAKNMETSTKSLEKTIKANAAAPLKASSISYVKIGIAQTLIGVVVQAGTSWVLGEFGISTGVEGEIAAIRSQLNEMQQTLNKIDAVTSQLRVELADSTFANLVHQASPIVANVNTGMKDLDFIANMSADDPTKAGLTHDTMKFIHDHLLFGKQLELADRISGTVGADGLIAAAYKVALAHHHLWTLETSLQVRAVVDYYEAAEVRLLLLRVEYMHAHPGAYSGHYSETQASDVEGMLAAQESLLKPAPIEGVVADTRTGLEWYWRGMSSEFSNVSPDTFARTEGLATVWGATGEAQCLVRNFYIFYVTCDIGKRWRLPSADEVTNLIAGWSDPSDSWLGWLNRALGGELERLNPLSEYAPHGVWTSTGQAIPTCPYYGCPLNHVIVGIARNGSKVASPRSGTDTRRSPFVVRARTSRYW